MEFIINILKNYWSDEPVRKSFGYTFFGTFFGYFLIIISSILITIGCWLGPLFKGTLVFVARLPSLPVFLLFLRLFCFLIKRKCFWPFSANFHLPSKASINQQPGVIWSQSSSRLWQNLLLPLLLLGEDHRDKNWFFESIKMDPPLL